MASSNQSPEINLYARSLKITHADPGCWNWVPGIEGSGNMFKYAAEIVDGNWLDIIATFNTENPLPGLYQVFFDVLVRDNCVGWANPVTVGLRYSNTNQKCQEKSVQITDIEPKNTWTTIEVGTVNTRNDTGGLVKIYMRGGDVMLKKKGLLIQGVRIRPKN